MVTMAGAIVGFALAIALLTVFLVASRLVQRRRRCLDGRMRPTIESTIVEYLAGDDDEPPPLPGARRGRALSLSVSRGLLSELRGGERMRLTRLLETSGAVDREIARMASRRAVDRRRAADALAQFESARAITALVDGLQDRDVIVRCACARGLAALGDPDALPAALDVVEGAVARSRERRPR